MNKTLIILGIAAVTGCSNAQDYYGNPYYFNPVAQQLQQNRIQAIEAERDADRRHNDVMVHDMFDRMDADYRNKRIIHEMEMDRQEREQASDRQVRAMKYGF